MPQESPAELSDRETLKAWIADRKIQCFEHALHLTRVPSDQLKHYGQKDLGTALAETLKTAAREIEKRVLAHEKKFPH